MLVPALAESKTRAHGISCLNNLKPMQLAWVMYAQDHDDWIPGNLWPEARVPPDERQPRPALAGGARHQSR